MLKNHAPANIVLTTKIDLTELKMKRTESTDDYIPKFQEFVDFTNLALSGEYISFFMEISNKSKPKLAEYPKSNSSEYDTMEDVCSYTRTIDLSLRGMEEKEKSQIEKPRPRATRMKEVTTKVAVMDPTRKPILQMPRN